MELERNSKKDLKKPLIFGAIGLLLFIIVIIAVALLQNSSKKDTNEILPPETPTMEEKVNSFQPLNIEEVKNDSLEKNNEKNLDNLNKNKGSLVEDEEKEDTKEDNFTSKVEEVKEIKNEALKKEKEISKQKPKAQIKTLGKNIDKKSSEEYYIQVAALLKNTVPNKKFLNLITSLGFKYTIYNTIVEKNNKKIKVKKILIGPFKSKKEALKILPKVKRDISQTAYILRIK